MSKNRAKSVYPLGGPGQFSEQAANMFHLKYTFILESIYLKQTRSLEYFLYFGLKLQKCLTKLISDLQSWQLNHKEWDCISLKCAEFQPPHFTGAVALSQVH